MVIDKSMFDEIGDHLFQFEGAEGYRLEAAASIPSSRNPEYIALLGHPHSLQGGSMQNKVVTTLARTFKELNIASVRFNFRGVGNSEGSFAKGIGESEDMLALAKQLSSKFSEAKFLFAGFSFGSYVAYRAASLCKQQGLNDQKLLVTIAPPVHHFDYEEFTPPSPWIIVQGDQDEVVSSELVAQFSNKIAPAPITLEFHTGHFFHGKLVELKERLLHCIPSVVSL